MERTESAEAPSFGERLRMGLRLIFNAAFAGQVRDALSRLWAQDEPSWAAPAAAAVPPERTHASGLFLLAALQREGRLVDFLQQDVTGFSDEEVGAAARVVHTGCSKVVKQYFVLQPAVPGDEGSTMSVPKGFDAQRIRLTGNVAGQPPFKGTLRHHGWIAQEVRWPTMAESLDPRVVAPAEVELS